MLFRYLVFLILCSQVLFAQPPGFVDELFSDDFEVPTGITFDKKGQMYVWEKSGKVFQVNKKNGVKKQVLDISEEVFDYLDHGLNGLDVPSRSQLPILCRFVFL